MPSASGVYSLPSGYLAVTGQTILASQHNPPLEDIAAALTLRLSRDGTAPMTGGLQGVAGSAPLPSFTFSTDKTSGIFKTTNGVGVTVAGTQVAEFTAAGLASGVWYPGMILPWVRATVPNSLWVFPVGQTLSRASYPTLWAIAQVEITAGSTFFNNGDGSTTFGIGDLRGRTIAAIDNMGGSDASRLNGSSLSSVRTTLGGAGGEGTHALIVGEIPSIASSGVNNININNSGQAGVATTSTPGNIGGTSVTNSGPVVVPFSTAGSWGGALSLTTSNSISVLSTGTNGTAHNNMQPTMLCQFAMFAGN